MRASDGTKRGGALIRLLPLIALALAGVALIAWAGGPREMLEQLSRQRGDLDALMVRLGLAAVLVYILAYAALMTLMWIPASLCTLIGGFLFGAWFGTLYALIGATAGGVVVFLLARYGFAGFQPSGRSMVAQLEAGFRADAFSYTLFLRLVPVVPFVVVNLVAAIVGVRLRTYTLATVLGILPATVIYANLGNGLGSLAGGGVDFSVMKRLDIALPLLGLACLALVPAIYHASKRRRTKSPAGPL